MSVSLKLKFWLFFYSFANILGLVLALIAPILLIVGVIGKGWILLTALLYVFGVLIGYVLGFLNLNASASVGSIDNNLNLVELFQKSVKPYQKQLPKDASAYLTEIENHLLAIEPKLSPHSDYYVDMKLAIGSYLPETLKNYEALPSLFRQTHVLVDGKTANTLLNEQLQLLSNQIKQYALLVSEQDSQAIVVQSEFLKQKFKKVDFLEL